MSLRTEIQTALTGDATIEGLVSTNIYHGLVPLNYNFSASSAIVFEARIAEDENTLDVKDWGRQYLLTVKAISLSSVDMESIMEAILGVLQPYTSTNVKDVMFERSNYVYDPDNDVHIESLDFTIWYLQ